MRGCFKSIVLRSFRLDGLLLTPENYPNEPIYFIVEVMLNLDSLKKSKVYQEGIEEGVLKNKLETIPRLIKLGLSSEQIAESLELDVETVRKNTQQ